MEPKFLQNCLMMVNKRESPKEGKTALTQQIYKGKGNLRECSNYRGFETG
jgi:hypothetical protein